VLFGCLFTVQASLVVLSPILPLVASDLQVTVATVGQLRTISGVVAAAVAVTMVLTNRRGSLRSLLVAGLGLLALGALASAVAPDFGVLAGAQVILGVGVALTLSGALAATRQWVPADQRGRALSWALIGQPAAWIVGLPIVGLIGDGNWRLSWLVPLLAGAATLAALARRGNDVPPASGRQSSPLRSMAIAAWAVAELLAYAGWAGVLVYAGALFSEVYGTSAGTIGLLLGVGAIAYLPGTLLARRWVGGTARRASTVFACAMATTVLALTAARPSPGFTLAVFALFAFLGGARSITGSSLGLQLSRSDPLRAMSLRTASVQFGYMTGAGLGGLALALAGWNGLGVVLAVLLALSAAMLLAHRTPPPEL